MEWERATISSSIFFIYKAKLRQNYPKSFTA